MSRSGSRKPGPRSLPATSPEGVAKAIAVLNDTSASDVLRLGAIRYCQVATTPPRRHALASRQLRSALEDAMNNCLSDGQREVQRRAREILNVLRKLQPSADEELLADLQLRLDRLKTYAAATPAQRRNFLRGVETLMGDRMADAVQGERSLDFHALCLQDLRDRGRTNEECLAFFSWLGHVHDDEAHLLAFLSTYPDNTGTFTAAKGFTEHLETLMRNQLGP
jgi:hypothetical protein